jgi:glutamate/tyrosine decarboxylase-like PLP-dependent enzyme
VELWGALRGLGKRGLAELIERACRHAQTFAAGLRAAGFAVLISEVQKDGTCWCGGTEWQGKTAIWRRFCGLRGNCLCR